MKFLKNKMSLRLRIFISMILLVFTATLLVLGSTYYQYRTESDQYNSYRQERKENQLKRQINYIVNKYNLSSNYDLWDDYQSDFEEITRIHSVEYSIFKIDGTPLFYSYLPLNVISTAVSSLVLLLTSETVGALFDTSVIVTETVAALLEIFESFTLYV